MQAWCIYYQFRYANINDRTITELTDYLTKELGFPVQKSNSFVSTSSRGSNDPLNVDDSPKCVIKPVQSAGSDCVFLCNSVDEAIDAFEQINGNSCFQFERWKMKFVNAGKVNGLGLINDGALIQEFLAGKEYVIDQVSFYLDYSYYKVSYYLQGVT